MDIEIRDRFIELWTRYFEGAELPLAFYYTRDTGGVEPVKAPATAHQCIIGVLNRARKGTTLVFEKDSCGCSGAKRYLGFTQAFEMPDFEYFLSCGIEGKVEGERYKKSPELVREMVQTSPVFEAPAPFLVFKRWDTLTETDEPQVVLFYGQPDILSGLFTLAGFDEEDRNAVISPFAAGCGAIVQYPCLETQRERPRAVLGMFDVSARPFVPRDTLSFAIPMNKFQRMIDNIEQSFLITPSWGKIKKRIKKSGKFDEGYVTL